jgi:cold shock CspA family protein
VDSFFDIIQRCLVPDPDARPDADEIVSECEQLCYQNMDREFGIIRRFDNSSWGFISADQGADVFFHVQSIFPSQRLKVGDRVWFARHRGGGSDRAFPVLKVN